MSRSRLEKALEISGRGALLNTLIMGEVLTRRGQTGPLARIWAPRGKKNDPSQGTQQPSAAEGKVDER